MQKAENQKIYDDIIKFYDYAERMIDAVEQNPEPSAELRLKLLEPIIEQIEESAEVLAETFIHFIETGEKPDEAGKEKVVNAIRKIYAVVSSYRENVKKIKFN